VVFTIKDSSIPTIQPISGGGAGSSLGRSLESVADFSVDKSIIQAHLFEGEPKNEKIIVSSKTKREIFLQLIGLEGVASLEESNFTISPGEKKEIEIFFNAESPGIFVGKVILSSGTEKKEVAVVAEVESSEALFDVRLSIPPSYKVLNPGDEIPLKIDLLNLGYIGKQTEAELYLFIMDLEKNIFEIKNELISIEDSITISKTVKIPDTLKDGNYMVLTEIRIGKTPISSYDTFLLQTKSKPEWYYLAVVFISIFIVLLISVLKRKRIFLFKHGLKNSSPHKLLLSKKVRVRHNGYG
jgi:hypothetical protein